MAGLVPRGKPPHNVQVLERWLTEASRDTGVAAGRLRRWLGFMVLAAMLDQARHAEDGEALFLIKGGVAVELRVGLDARATKDLDAALRSDISTVAQHLDPVLRRGHGDFTAIRTELEPVRDTGAVRCDIKLAYRGRPLSTVRFEVAPAEGSMGTEIDRVAATTLDHLGITGPDTVACLAIRWQIAQKLHACTEVLDGADNDRYRDLLDLQLLAALVADDDWAALRAACIQVFDERAKQPWPPTVTVYPAWVESYRALAQATGFSGTDVDAAAAAVQVLIDQIGGH